MEAISERGGAEAAKTKSEEKVGLIKTRKFEEGKGCAAAAGDGATEIPGGTV